MSTGKPGEGHAVHQPPWAWEVHELRMAEAMDDIIREREKDLKRSLMRHVY